MFVFVLSAGGIIFPVQALVVKVRVLLLKKKLSAVLCTPTSHKQVDF